MTAMQFPSWLTRKRIAAGSSVLLVAFLIAGFVILRRPPRTPMERYAPADALAFIEIDSLTDLLDGLTSTRAWRELAPVLGLSSQLRQVGFVADLIGRAGLGPDEAVLAGRAQCAIVITGLQSNSGETDEGPYVHLKPHFALVIETHMSPESASRLVRDRGPLVAQRIFGEVIAEEPNDSRDSVWVFHGPGSDRQLLAASVGSIVVAANEPQAMNAVLDAISGRSKPLAEDENLTTRSEINHQSPVFAYITATGIQKLAGLWPLLVAGRATEPESAGLFGDLIENLSRETEPGLLYSLEFQSGSVTEKYLTTLRPRVAEALAQPMKAASGASFESLPLIPKSIDSLTLLRIERPGELPERMLKQLTPNVDVVAGVTLREFIINFRKQYGLEPSDSIGDAIGDEAAVVNFGSDQPRALVLRVNDRTRVQAGVVKYLSRKGGSINRQQQDEAEIMISSSDDRRAAAFVENFLVLGTIDQIQEIIRTRASRDGIDGDERLRQVLTSRPANSSVILYRPEAKDAARLMLAISKLTRATDGSFELLDRESARVALNRLQPSTSYTEFRNTGVLTETRSAVGNLSALASLIGGRGD